MFNSHFDRSLGVFNRTLFYRAIGFVVFNVVL